MGYLVPFSVGICLEYLSTLALFPEVAPVPMSLPKILFSHAGADLCIAWGLYGLLPPKYRTYAFRSFCYCFIIVFFIPVIGCMGLLTVNIIGIGLQKAPPEKGRRWHITGQALMPYQAHEMHRNLKFGAHGMLSRLRKSDDLKAHLGIVLATRFMREENAVPLLNIALRNPQDDVRLLAFTLLEKKNAHINTNIEHLQKSLKQKTGTAKIHVAIAENYLWQVTLGLIQQEMKDQVLDLASRHLDQALAEDAGFRNGYFLLGKVRLEQGKVDQAEAAFHRALELGFAATDIYPFLAQAAFLKREFRKIPDYLQQVPLEHHRYEPLAKVCTSWLSDRRESERLSQTFITPRPHENGMKPDLRPWEKTMISNDAEDSSVLEARPPVHIELFTDDRNKEYG